MEKLEVLEIFEILRKKRSVAFQDLTFENLESGDLKVSGFVDQLEAGDG